MRLTRLAFVALYGCGRIADVPDAGTDAGVCSDDFGASSRWSFFDIADVSPPKPGFVGGAYADQHVYFAPTLNDQTKSGSVVRTNIVTTFTLDSSWDSFDLTTIDPSFVGFGGAVSDKQSVYLFSGSHALILRHDVAAPLSSAWSSFDVVTVDPKASTFGGALALDQSVIFSGSWFARYDATLAFDDPTAWRTADFVGGCNGNAFDGRYAYFACASTIQRYDTTLPINSPVPWSSYVLPSSLNTAFSAAFDGQFAYFAPYQGTTIARVDTKAPFKPDGSWSFIDLAPLAPAFGGALDLRFDGRYVYASPPELGSVMARFDTHGSFTDLGAWSTLDVSTLDPRAQKLFGSVFDGRYLYLAPSSEHVAARYDTLGCGGD